MAENSLVQDFVCDYCGGEVDGYFKFQVFINEGTPDEETAISCPDCIATWFTETPEDVKNMRVIKLEGE
jgi:hypothetical protein